MQTQNGQELGTSSILNILTILPETIIENHGNPEQYSNLDPPKTLNRITTTVKNITVLQDKMKIWSVVSTLLVQERESAII